MKSFIAFSIAFLTSILLAAQSAPSTPIPKLVKKTIGQSGCSAYCPEGMPDFELSQSEDSSDVYTSEIEVNGFFYSCIAVKFKEPFTDSSPEELEALLMSYLEYLEDQFKVIWTAGAGNGHLLESAPDARGVLNYWKDIEGTQFAVKGWVSQKALGVMILYGEEEYPNLNLQQMYLNGFRFEK